MPNEHVPSRTRAATKRISLMDRGAVARWQRRLNCSEYELRAAVYAVGSRPVSLQGYFERSASSRLARP